MGRFEQIICMEKYKKTSLSLRDFSSTFAPSSLNDSLLYNNEIFDECVSCDKKEGYLPLRELTIVVVHYRSKISEIKSPLNTTSIKLPVTSRVNP